MTARPDPAAHRAGAPRTQAVLQGEYRLSDDPRTVLSTVLGSCVAVCLHDPVRRIGGMNHYLLARGGSGPADSATALRYGAHAIEVLINALLRAGAERGRLVARAYGGARITEAFSDIGRANASFARDYLAREGIPLLAEDLGGRRARRLHFAPASGEVTLALVAATAVEERPPPRPEPPRSGAITLF